MPKEPLSKAVLDAFQMFRDVGRGGAVPIRDRRANYEAMLERVTAASPPPAAERTSYDSVPCVVVEPSGGAPINRTVIALHGGGYFMGSAWGYRGYGLGLAKFLDARVVLVDYRLTPEHPFPAAIDDAVRVLESVTAERAAGGTPEVILTGDSAGGGLAFGTVLEATRRGAKLPDALIAVSPLLDLTASGESHSWNSENDPAVSRVGIGTCREALLNGREITQAQTASPLAAPVEQLSEFCDVMLLASSSEILLSDSLTMANKLACAGRSVLLHVEPDVPHVWPLFWASMPQARRALAMMSGFLSSRATGRHHEDPNLAVTGLGDYSTLLSPGNRRQDP